MRLDNAAKCAHKSPLWGFLFIHFSVKSWIYPAFLCLPRAPWTMSVLVAPSSMNLGLEHKSYTEQKANKTGRILKFSTDLLAKSKVWSLHTDKLSIRQSLWGQWLVFQGFQWKPDGQWWCAFSQVLVLYDFHRLANISSIENGDCVWRWCFIDNSQLYLYLYCG